MGNSPGVASRLNGPRPQGSTVIGVVGTGLIGMFFVLLQNPYHDLKQDFHCLHCFLFLPCFHCLHCFLPQRGEARLLFCLERRYSPYGWLSIRFNRKPGFYSPYGALRGRRGVAHHFDVGKIVEFVGEFDLDVEHVLVCNLDGNGLVGPGGEAAVAVPADQ